MASTENSLGKLTNDVDDLPKFKELPKKIKYLTALNIFYGNFAFGVALNAHGPALTTIQNKYGVGDSTISNTFSILTGCSMVGALLGGTFIFDRLNRQLVVIVTIFMKALSMFVTMHCPSLATYFLSVALLGIASGAYDNAQFVWMMEMMQKDCPPFVQTQHFSYALGTIVGPLLMAPFLEDDDSISTEEKAEKLVIPFSIVGLILTLNAVFQIILFTFFRYFKPPPEEVQTQLDNNDPVAYQAPDKPRTLFGTELWSWPKLRFVLLGCAFYGAYQGMELTTFQFFPKFGQNSALNLTESQAAYVMTGLTGAYAAGRGAAIILIFKVSGQIFVCVNIVLLTIANIILIVWAEKSKTWFWSASIIYGLGFASSFASFSAYIERYLNITNFIGSLFLICAYGVPAVYPFIIGNFIEENPVVLGYVTFFSIALVVIAVGSLSYLTHKNKVRY